MKGYNLDSSLRGILENKLDEYIKTLKVYDKGIQKTEKLLQEYNISDKVPNTTDLIMGYHIGRMLQYSISSVMPKQDDAKKIWSIEDIWSLIQSRLSRLSEKIETELHR